MSLRRKIDHLKKQKEKRADPLLVVLVDPIHAHDTLETVHQHDVLQRILFGLPLRVGRLTVLEPQPPSHFDLLLHESGLTQE